MSEALEKGRAGWRSGPFCDMGALTKALAVIVIVALFRSRGPKRTRLVSQIVAAVVGAAFVIVGSRPKHSRGQLALAVDPGGTPEAAFALAPGRTACSGGRPGPRSHPGALAAALGISLGLLGLIAVGGPSETGHCRRRRRRGRGPASPAQRRPSARPRPWRRCAAASGPCSSAALAGLTDPDAVARVEALELWRNFPRSSARCWSLCSSWSWRPDSSPASWPGWRSPARTRRSWSPRRRSRGGRSSWPRSRRCSAPSRAVVAPRGPGPGAGRASAGAGHGGGDRGLGRLGDRDPDLVPRPGQAQRLPSPRGTSSRCHLRRPSPRSSGPARVARGHAAAFSPSSPLWSRSRCC